MATIRARDLEPGMSVKVDGGYDTVTRIESYPKNVRVHFQMGYLDAQPDREVTYEPLPTFSRLMREVGI